jgi:predicted ATPase/transcriptional regulator with XRE-family HTH domain
MPHRCARFQEPTRTFFVQGGYRAQFAARAASGNRVALTRGRQAVDDESAFGRLLKRCRRAAHLTQETLAERAGYSSHYVSMLERGVRFPQPLTVAVLADALALSERDRQALSIAAVYRPPAAAPMRHMPPPTAPLIGRELDVTRIVSLLHGGDVRLLTLTGPGGVGKTSLAQQVVAMLGASFPVGTTFVDLATVSTPADVIPTIARALALRDTGDQPIHERLVKFLCKRQALLLLDSFEGVVDAAEAIGHLIASCQGVTFVITSRTLLRLHAEHEFRVQPLVLPEPGRPESLSAALQSPAVALFVQLAMLVKPELMLGDEQAAVIADICRRLDGLPLAIELAAARVSHLPLAALHDRLQHRLQVLTGGTRDLPARQQRMRDTIAWSYDLLPRPKQALLRQLSVFAGSWSLEAAEEVCITGERRDADDDVLDGLRTLVESSLVIPVEDISDEPRYRMLDTIREYAAEQLAISGERDALRQRHSVYYVRLAERVEPALQNWEQRVWYPRLERECDNLQVALDWLLATGEAELALRLAGAVWRFWQRHGDFRKGRRWLDAGLAASEAQRTPEQVRAKALWGATWLAYHQGDYVRSRSLSVEHLALAREHGDMLGVRNALTGLGMADLAEGRSAEAVRSLQEALDVCAPLGNTWHYATSVLNLGNATMLAGDLPRAEALFEEALTLYRERGDEVFTARTRQHLGYVALLRGEYQRAGMLFGQSLQALYDLGEQPGIADGLEAVAALRAAMGDARQAGRLIDAAANLREHVGIAPLPYLRAIWRSYVAKAEAPLGEPEWRAVRGDVRTLSLQEAVASALDETR